MFFTQNPTPAYIPHAKAWGNFGGKIGKSKKHRVIIIAIVLLLTVFSFGGGEVDGDAAAQRMSTVMAS